MGTLTQDEKDAIRDAAVATWWKDWFRADYSWDGLRQIDWQGWVVVEDKAAYDDYIRINGLPKGCPNIDCHVVPADKNGLPKGVKTRPATLQDYWRDQKKSLQGQKGGKQYTIAHLPVRFPDGSESWKADPDHENWQTLSALITQRLACGVKTDLEIGSYGFDTVKDRDGRANFSGCILQGLPSQTQQETNGEDKAALHLSLYQAAILQPQNFSNAIFGSPSNLGEALFDGGNADFRGAQFSGGDASFRNAHFSGGHASFDDAQFSGGDANFRNVQFGGDADFYDAQFSGGYVNFRNAQFSGGDASFDDAQFTGGYASFYDAKFSGGNASFLNVQFSGDYANFRNAQFSGGNASFLNAEFFGDYANFRNALFSGGDANFTNAQFEESFNFKDATFDKLVTFKNAIFPPAAGTQSVFHGTQFLGPADFTRAQFKNRVGNDLPEDNLHFPFNAFHHAKIKDQLTLTQRGEKEAQIEFDRALNSTAEACEGKTDDEKEAHYVALEAGCTTLKRAMETISDKNRAQRFFKFELLARQKRPSTPWLVKKFTRFYGWTADYGGSMAKPIGALLCFWLLFTAIYGVNAHLIDVRTSNPFHMIWGAMDFSATHIFRPLFIWSKSAASSETSWLAQYQHQLSEGGWLFIKLLATAQSFLSITLIFLFGLATKRKFQIG